MEGRAPVLARGIHHNFWWPTTGQHADSPDRR